MGSLESQVLVLVAVYAIVWQGYKLRRRISGFAHVGLLVFVVGTLLPQIVSYLTRHQHWIPPDVGFIAADAASNVPVVGLLLFRFGLEQRPVRDPRVLLTVAAGVLASAAVIVSGVLFVRTGMPLLIDDPGPRLSYPPAAVSALLNSVFRIVMIVWFVVWVFRYTGRAGTPRPIRHGMRVAAAGILVMAYVVGTSLVSAVADIAFGYPVRGSHVPLMVVGEAIAGVCWTVGLSYPLIASRIAARRAARDQRRSLDDISVLWRAGLTAFPELGRPDDGRREPAAFQLQRRTAECYDCLHHLRFRDGGTATSSSRAAIRLLTAVLARYESRYDASVWAVIDRDRATSPPGTGDIRLLADLAALVTELDDDRVVA